MASTETKKMRIAYIVQKGVSLERFIANLQAYVDNPNYNATQTKLRLTNIDELFKEYSSLNDELATLRSNHPRLEAFSDIETNYYNIATIVTDRQNTVPRAHSTLNTSNLTISERQDRPKLPTIQIPKFDGKHSQWVSWKHCFENLVHCREDLSNYVKHTQLINSVSDTAAKKIAAFPPSEENYSRAWEALCDAFDQKRIIVSEHLDAILELPVVTKSNPDDLSILIDDTKQHISMLKEIKIDLNTFSEQMIIRILERRLPPTILTKWHERLDGNELPTLDELFKFIQSNIFRLRALDRVVAPGGRGAAVKRGGENNNNQTLSKIKRVEGRSLVTSANTVTNTACPKCAENHPLYRCPAFEKLNVPDRWKVVKANNLCRNCLRKHQNSCSMKSLCKKCGKDHNTLIHFEKPSQKTKKPQKVNEQRVEEPSLPKA